MVSTRPDWVRPSSGSHAEEMAEMAAEAAESAKSHESTAFEHEPRHTAESAWRNTDGKWIQKPAPSGPAPIRVLPYVGSTDIKSNPLNN